MGAAPPNDRRVVSNGSDRFGRVPDAAFAAITGGDGLHPAPVADIIGDLGPLEFPRVPERQPLLGVFLLPPVLNDLTEQPVVVADAVAAGRQAEARRALHKAGGESAEAAIP